MYPEPNCIPVVLHNYRLSLAFLVPCLVPWLTLRVYHSGDDQSSLLTIFFYRLSVFCFARYAIPLSQFDAIAGDVYPELYANFISKLNPINLDLDFALSYSCFVANDFYDHLLFATIVPFLVLTVLAGSYVIGTKRNSGSESAMRKVQHKHQTTLLYIAFFIYSPVSHRIFQTFNCDGLDDGETYLRADYSLSCRTSRHSWFKAYALVMVLVYPVGVAAAFAWLLVSYRRDLVKSNREAMVHLKPLHAIWAAYRPCQYYYEVVECIRRIALTAIAALVPSNSMANVSGALLCAVVFVFVSEVLSPFNRGVDMGLYRWGNGVIVGSMYVAFLMKADVGYDTKGALLTFSGVLILANVFMMVAVLVQIAFVVKAMRRVKEPVRRVDIPVRRTFSLHVRPIGSENEEGTAEEGLVNTEAKVAEIH